MSASREITLQEEIERLRAENAKLRAAIERTLKFIRLGNHPNAGDMLNQAEAALEEMK